MFGREPGSDIVWSFTDGQTDSAEVTVQGSRPDCPLQQRSGCWRVWTGATWRSCRMVPHRPQQAKKRQWCSPLPLQQRQWRFWCTGAKPWPSLTVWLKLRRVHWQADRHLQLICSYCNKALGPKWNWSCEGQWPYFDLSAAAGVSTPYSFMLVSGALAVSSGHGLCERRVWMHSPAKDRCRQRPGIASVWRQAWVGKVWQQHRHVGSERRCAWLWWLYCPCLGLWWSGWSSTPWCKLFLDVAVPA